MIEAESMNYIHIDILIIPLAQITSARYIYICLHFVFKIKTLSEVRC